MKNVPSVTIDKRKKEEEDGMLLVPPFKLSILQNYKVNCIAWSLYSTLTTVTNFYVNSQGWTHRRKKFGQNKWTYKQ